MADVVTIGDVARLAHVSTATVSRALSGSRPVSQEATLAVLRASEKLSYRRNQVARALRRRSTQIIGLVVPDVTNPFFPALIQAVEVQLNMTGMGLLLVDSLNDREIERQNVEQLLGRQVDGLLISPCDRQHSRATVTRAAEQVPVVQMDRRASKHVDFVGMDHEGGIRMILDYLTAGGRRHCVFLGAGRESSSSYERRRAFIRWARRAGGEAQTRVIDGEFSVEWGREGALAAVRRWPDTDAVVCADDLIAVGALKGLGAAGIAVPGQVAVTGLDDTALASVVTPTLTSVRQPLSEMAERALAILADGGSRKSPRCARLVAELIPRESTDIERVTDSAAVRAEEG